MKMVDLSVVMFNCRRVNMVIMNHKWGDCLTSRTGISGHTCSSNNENHPLESGQPRVLDIPTIQLIRTQIAGTPSRMKTQVK